MKRLRSSDDLDSYNEKSSSKDSGLNRSSSRSFYYKSSDTGRKGLISTSSSSSRFDRDRSNDDDGRESSRIVRKRSDHDFDSFDRRKGSAGFDRYGSSREGYSSGGGGGVIGNERSMHRSESFCGPRREFPKGFRSERDRSRREGSVSSWRRFGTKEFDESSRGGSRSGNEDRINSAVTARSSPKGLREVKSPTWSRDSSGDQTRVVRGGGKEEGKVKSSNSKSRSSSTWSKDSESEQSKSVEVAKKSEVEAKSLEVEAKSVEVETKSVGSGNSSSEMEEGELEPEPESAHQFAKEEKNDDREEKTDDTELGADHTDIKRDIEVKDQVDGIIDNARLLKREDVMKEVRETENHEEGLNNNAKNSTDEVAIAGSAGGNKEGASFMEKEIEEEGSEDTVSERSTPFDEEIGQDKGIDLEMKADEAGIQDTTNEFTAENRRAELTTVMAAESLSLNLKDKGKSVAAPLIHAANSAENGVWIERETKEAATYRGVEDDMEGPSTRGFDLFTSSPVRREEKPEISGASKQKEEKLVLEPLDLSLSLPNVLLPIGASRETAQAPGSPSQGRSVHSFSTFRTNSDGFTASMSFSGSQSFFHNPSCSLTQNSMDMDNYEQSVHSRPIFQGLEQGAWPGQGPSDSKPTDIPLYQRILMNGNGSKHQSQASHGMPNGQALQGSSKVANGLERQLSFHKQMPGGQARNHDDMRSPSQSVGSHDMGSNYSIEKKRSTRDRHGGSLHRSNSQKEQEQFLIGGAEFVETIISRIVGEPVYVMARKFHEMTAQSAACLKESIHEIMLNADKQGQASTFKAALHNRSDLTMDVLLKSHRTQLEILVALKMGLPEYLRVDNGISSSDLAEVFLNLRCRNLTCRNLLPVDECDCKVCVKKNGFCSSCMCLVCSKFDMASNTCSWVGCDVCLHWCHADCALRKSYIRNGRSATGAQGPTEMQFHCVACDHPSEMFGFVKEVFQNFAKEWTAEAFCKELEYVKRIFSASKDIRGRRLHEIADMMLLKLSNKSYLPDVYNYVMGFLNESNPPKLGNAAVFDGKEQANKSSVGISGPSHDSTWLKSVYSEKAALLEKPVSLLPTFHTDLNDKRPLESELPGSTPKEPVFDELESIVRIKQAEAKMFQARADDARREAEGLKRIAAAKNEKIEEEYASRLRKLRLVETEEMRKQKFEEFQALERAHREYFSMKMRMEADIKDLLLKMEATRRNLAI